MKSSLVFTLHPSEAFLYQALNAFKFEFKSKFVLHASNLNSLLQVNWEKTHKNIMQVSGAISKPILAQYGPYEPSTTLVCWISLVKSKVQGWQGYSWICWENQILLIFQIHVLFEFHGNVAFFSFSQITSTMLKFV